LDIVSGNNGTLQGSATYAPGEVGQGFEFDGGNNSYLLVPYSNSLAPGTGSFTIECWINPGKSTGYIWQQYALGSLGSGGQDDIELSIGTSLSGNETNTPTFGLRDSSGSLQNIYASNQLSDGQFHHLAAGRDVEGQTVFLYVDGVPYTQALTAAGSLFFDGHTAPLMIGDAYWCCGQSIGSYESPFAGVIDEISYYNRALSSNEIAAIYYAGSGGKCMTPIIVTQPSNQAVAFGSNTTFSVAVTGIAPLLYQWQFDGSNLAAAINTNIVFNVVSSTNAGNYDVVIGNPYGSITSAVVALSVLGVPVSFVTTSGGIQFSNGQLHLSLSGLTGQGPVVIDASTNLTQWTPIFTNPSGFGTIQFVDPTATNYPSRYYRATTPGP